MNVFNSTFTPEQMAIAIIILGGIFVTAWFYDHKMHLEIWKRDITDGELRTHRMILYASWALLFSLVIMKWFPIIALPLFIGSYITRFWHEAMDELHWHLPRCTERETLIHLVMWITVNSGTAAVFIWGFFFSYQGFEALNPFYHILLGVITLFSLYIGHHEIVDYKDSDKRRIEHVASGQ